MVEIRARRNSDLADLAEVAGRVHAADNYPIFLPDGDLIAFLTRPASIAAWVCVRDDELIGHVALNDTTSRPVMELVEASQPEMTPCYLARLLVDPSSRGDGAGGLLLEHARQAALRAGRSLFLDVVNTPTSTAAISLYRTAGWDEMGRVRFDLAGEELEELVLRAPIG